MTNPTADPSPTGDRPTPPLPRKVMILVSAALGLVVLAPMLLSSQDLYGWGETGLGLPAGWAALVPIALDCAAASCIGMAIIATVRRERPGLFGLLVWVFAGTSGYAQYRHGISVIALAPDAYWAFPTFAVLGPALLHVVMARLRRWARQDAREQQTGAAGFGSSWVPGVAFRETAKAWAASRREGISVAADARAYVRQVDALADLTGPERVRYAYDALHNTDPAAARTWLQARRAAVTQADLDTAAVQLAAGSGTPAGTARAGASGTPGTPARRKAGTATSGTGGPPAGTSAAGTPVHQAQSGVPESLGTLARSAALFAVQQAYPQWRETYRDTRKLPSVRECARLAGKPNSTSAGQAIQADLVRIYEDEQLAALSSVERRDAP